MKVKTENGVLHKYEKERSKLRIGGQSWTVQLDWLTPEVHTVIYETTNKIYRISVDKIKEVGFKRIFQGEPKFVIPIKHWETINK